jgi:SP family general alpha glucoside:H+ symporter-like MFS transporter
MGFSTYFYKQAGLPDVAAFDLSMVQYALGIVGTIGSFFLLSRAGRRTLYLHGSIALFALLLIIGFTAIAPATNIPSRWAIGIMLLLFTFIYDLSVGPVCFTLITELPSTRLKTKTIVLARNVYNVGGIAVNVLATHQLTPPPTGWGWGAKSAFFWAVSCFLCIVWIHFRLPEPKGRTYAEIDALFKHGVSARKFRDTRLDFSSGHLAPVSNGDSGSESGIDKAEVELAEKIQGTVAALPRNRRDN